MADLPNKISSNSEDEQVPVTFAVMPRGDYGKNAPIKPLTSAPPAPAPKPPSTPIPIIPKPSARMSDHPVNQNHVGKDALTSTIDGGSGLPMDHTEPHFWQRRSTYWVLGILIVGALGGCAYFLLGPDLNKNNNLPASRLPSTFTQQYFQVAVCANELSCGDDADPDDDGLTNYDEFLERTSPVDNDSDDDGLADGDEKFIYQTDPVDKYTDKRQAVIDNDYLDGVQVANSYDPLTPGIKMTDSRKAKIQENIAKFFLHEPTKTTLSSVKTTPAEPKTVTIFINDGKLDTTSLEINMNDTVIWLNKDSVTHQIISDPHPAHTDLKDLVSPVLQTNQTYSYKFTQIGTFKYHDELKTSIQGSIIVK